MTGKIVVLSAVAVVLLGATAMNVWNSDVHCNNYNDQWIGGAIFVLAVLLHVTIAVAARAIFRCKFDPPSPKNRPRRSVAIGESRSCYGALMVEASLPDQAEPFRPAHHSTGNPDRDSDGEEELGFETANDRSTPATPTTTRTSSSRPSTDVDLAPGAMININITNVVNNNYNRDRD